MEPYLRREKFEQYVLEDMSGFVEKYTKDIGYLPKRDFETKVDTIFGRNSHISRVATELGVMTKLNKECVELITRISLEFSYNIYKADIERVSKENSNLRRELRSAQQKSRSSVITQKKKVKHEQRNES